MKILAVDVGGTNVKLGVVSGGQVLRSTAFGAHGASGAAQLLQRLGAAMRDLAAEAGAPLCGFDGVGIALPTLVDTRSTRVLVDMVGKFEGIAAADLRGWAQRELNLPLKIENDAHCALLGEWRFGAGQGASDLVMITLGTGIGTSVIIGNRPLRGAHSQTGNLGGHLVMQTDGPACSCGGRGCAESLHHLNTVNQLARADARFPASALAQFPRISYADLFNLAAQDALAWDLMKRSLDIWGSLCVSLIHAFDPERLIVGGGIMRSSAVILPHLREWARHACAPWGQGQVLAGELGDSAALLGVASLFENPPDFL